MKVRCVRPGAVILAGLLVASCSSLGSVVGDNLPVWAGGLPEGTPPRAGTPGYPAYVKAISGGQPANVAEPAAAPQPQSQLPQSPPSQSPPPRIHQEPIDDPIH